MADVRRDRGTLKIGNMINDRSVRYSFYIKMIVSHDEN